MDFNGKKTSVEDILSVAYDMEYVVIAVAVTPILVAYMSLISILPSALRTFALTAGAFSLLHVLPLAAERDASSYDEAPRVARAAIHHAGRDYYSPISVQERKNISYVVRTIAKSNTIELAWHALALNRTREKLDHMHPFKFIECIFADEALRKFVIPIKEKGGIGYRKFVGGMTSSLTKEAAVNNVKPYVDDFAAVLHIDPQLIRPAIHRQRWDDLLHILITQLCHD